MKTVIVIKGYDSESDSRDYILDVYIVPRKKFNAELEYLKYLFKKVKELTQIPVEWEKNDYVEGLCYPKKFKRGDSKLLDRIEKKYNMNYFLETECNGKRVDFCEYFK